MEYLEQYRRPLQASPLAVAAPMAPALLLPHLEGEEPPEGFRCGRGRVSDGEGSINTWRIRASSVPLFELSKEEPGGRSIRAIACYFLPLAPRAFVQSGELGFPLWFFEQVESKLFSIVEGCAGTVGKVRIRLHPSIEILCGFYGLFQTCLAVYRFFVGVA